MLLIAAMHIGCGGGGENYAGGGIGGTGVVASSVGTVTAFGSVIVNGVTYETTGAEVFTDNTSRGSGDTPLAQNLAVGMVVRVEGRLNADGSSSADRVFYENYLRGPVESITDLDSRSKLVVILGQTILMDDRTVFRGTTAVSIATGLLVEVSGYLDELGRIAATYIAKIADSIPADRMVQIKGAVQDLNAAAKTFNINSLEVDYATADLSRLPGNTLEEGQHLRITGRLQAVNVLTAEDFESAEEFGSGLFDSVDLEGIITQTRSPAEFEIGRYTILTDATTAYTNLAPQDLNRGTRVIVRGALTGRSILADEISLPEKIKLESNVASVSPVEKSLVLSGLESITVLTTATTRFNGKADSLDQILPGDHIRIVGRRAPNGELLGSSLLITVSNETVKITGPVESATSPTLVILGAEINTGSIPADGFFGRDGKPVSPGEFFGSVMPDDYVAVEGGLQEGSVIWNAVGFE
ncbi:MAG: hypothetical protein HY895_13740 [Deltaproteobacteria bacterium]|nr:hypothetical protein [Deltaproteobacteria bacterium]